MIAIKMSFPGGRFCATPWGRHVNEGQVEWPPSSWRFLRAMIAVFYRKSPKGLTKEGLQQILRALAIPPHFILPRVTVSHTRHYDQANKGVKFFDTFVAIHPEDVIIWWWQEALLDADAREHLRALLLRLVVFGRSESWCECSLMEEEEFESYLTPELKVKSSVGTYYAPILSTHVMTQDMQHRHEPVRVLVPDAAAESLLEHLEIDTGKLRKEKKLEPSGACYVTYHRHVDALRPGAPAWESNMSDKDGKVSLIRFTLDSKVRPRIKDAIDIADFLRRAILDKRHKLPTHSLALIGKLADQRTRLEGHEHAHFVCTDEDGDGHIDHLTVYAPMGFDRHDLEAASQLRALIREDEYDLHIVMSGQGDATKMVEGPLLAPARIWRSATAFNLPNYATGGAGRRPRTRDLPEEQLKKELQRRNFPAPVEVRVLPTLQMPGRPEVRWTDFRARRPNKPREGYGLVGLEIRFAEPVAGPILLGANSHFGLGAFVGADARAGEE